MKRKGAAAAVIGAGPAGCAAAVQLKRCGVESLLFERDAVGGLVRNARRLENLPGFPEGVAGRDFAALLERHLKAAGVTPIFTEIIAVRREDGGFVVSAAQREYRVPFAIAASGTEARVLAGAVVPPGYESRFRYEVAGMEEEAGKNILVVGGGDVAFDYALTLAARNDVTVAFRGREPKSIPPLKAAAEAHARIALRPGATVVGFSGAGRRVQALFSAAAAPVVVDYVVVAVGREPATSYLEGAANENTPGLYYAGDVVNGDLRQAAVAAGDGVRAALLVAKEVAGAS